MATIAEFYSDNLGHEVRKGMQQKLKSGGWPHLAPPGYVNVRVNTPDRKAEAIVVIDCVQGPLAFQASSCSQPVSTPSTACTQK